jgi:hypothetical protein
MGYRSTMPCKWPLCRKLWSVATRHMPAKATHHRHQGMPTRMRSRPHGMISRLAISKMITVETCLVVSQPRTVHTRLRPYVTFGGMPGAHRVRIGSSER